MTITYVLFNIELGEEKKALEEIRKIRYVTEAFSVYGVYDAIARFELNEYDNIKNQEAIKNEILSARKKLKDDGLLRGTLTMQVAGHHGDFIKGPEK
jgi:hypothetical protein